MLRCVAYKNWKRTRWNFAYYRGNRIKTNKVYRDILKHQIVSSHERLFCDKYIFRHDNYPNRKSKTCKKYIEELETRPFKKIMDWLS